MKKSSVIIVAVIILVLGLFYFFGKIDKVKSPVEEPTHSEITTDETKSIAPVICHNSDGVEVDCKG